MKKTNTLYGLLMAFYYISFCLTVAFTMRFLQEKEFSNPEIAMAAMFAAIACLVAQPLWGHLFSIGLPVRALLLVSSAVTTAGYFLLTYTGRDFVLAAVAVSVIASGIQAVPGIVDTWGIKLIDQGVELNFGKTRSMGSLSYAVTAVLFGILLDALGMRITPWLMIASTVPMAVILWLLPVPEMTKGEKTDIISSVKELWKHRTYKYYVFTNFLAMTSMAAYISFLPVFMTELGGGSAEIGWAYGLMAFTEVIVMPQFERLRKRFGTRKLFITSIIGTGVKNVAISLAINPLTAILAFTTQVFAGALNFPVMAAYVNENIDRKHMATAQVLLNALGIALGMVAANIFVGRLADTVGVRYMLMLMAAPSFIGGLILWLATRKRRVV